MATGEGKTEFESIHNGEGFLEELSRGGDWLFLPSPPSLKRGEPVLLQRSLFKTS